MNRISLTLQPGTIGVLGPNGAGKTTLLRTLATIMPPSYGSILFDDIEIDTEQKARSVRSRIGYLPQDFGFDPQMTVADFVAYAAWMRGVEPGEWNRSIDRVLEMVDLTDRRRSKMRKLSGGMRRRAGIAWAIVGNPQMVLLDEPTVGLDPRQRLQFRSILSGLDDAIVLLSTHLTDDVAAACDRVIVMHSGEVRFDGSVIDLSSLSREDLPGHSDLEKAYMHVLPESERQV
ncbi:ATP-binding cassette domain-containing protein [Solwaraspora sp. WMMA2080]|uniref:ATP-binding cassette domain-containing protein n=1 Tax=unclassified Solwaraspora TaxID=2627926 RepID=UPI00248B22DF|nr:MULTISPECIES: ATP-binding cassette domain-containing protein [unclassified Solwaraspora]WBB97002.1 ATP-binding cassette domain-containing protein [Solwaraspora sp. WMMA2059]WBC19095.1 ATP-binding cassette domain-containing protein [Solwaraspora sp. WMMA2080]